MVVGVAVSIVRGCARGFHHGCDYEQGLGCDQNFGSEHEALVAVELLAV